jgi:hypothetical protein
MLTGPRDRKEDDNRLLLGDAWVDRLVREDPDLRWVVVDDLVAGACELAISPWPELNDEGRLTFASSEDDYAFGVMDAEKLHGLVRAARRKQFGKGAAPEVVERELRVGDAFAIRVKLGHGDAVTVRGGSKGVGDVCARARVFAKVQEAVADDAPVKGAMTTNFRDGNAPER